MRIIAALVVLRLFTTAALADSPAATPQSAPASGELVESYRFQTAAVDAVALATAIGAARDADQLGDFALGTYLLGAPIIHLLHHRPGRALGSLAMRAGIPVAAAWLLVSMHTNSCPSASSIASAPRLRSPWGLAATDILVADENTHLSPTKREQLSGDHATGL